MDINLNLFRTFVAMFKHRTLKEVAKALGKGESAVSKQLHKLSEQLGYTLFEQGDSGLEPTPAAINLYPKVLNALTVFDEALLEQKFDPLAYKEPITIALHASLMEFNGPKILAELIKTFPNAVPKLTIWGKQTKEQLLKEEIDLGINFFNEELSASLYQKIILQDELVMISSGRQHDLTFDEALKLPLVLTLSADWNDTHYPYLEFLAKNNIHFTIGASVESFSLALKYIQTQDAICFVLKSTLDEAHQIHPLPKHLRLPMNFSTCIKVTHRTNALTIALIECMQRALAY